MTNLPGQTPSPAANIVDVIQNIQAWGTTVVICLIIIALTSSVTAFIVFREALEGRKERSRGRSS